MPRFLDTVIFVGFALFGMMSVAVADTQIPIETETTRVRFSCSAGILAVAGRFEAVRGLVDLERKSPSPRTVQITIGSESLTTGHAMIDRQLKGPNFFDSANHPTIFFESTAVSSMSTGEAQVAGRLTVKTVTRPVTLQVALDAKTLEELAGHEEPTNGSRIIRASAQIRRSDFGMAGFDALISDECDIQIRVALPESVLNE